MRIAIIACGKAKIKGKHQAKDLYVGNFFKQCLKVASTKYDAYYIVSAKYGLLKPVDVIEDYDFKLTKLSERQKKQWGFNVAQQINQTIESTNEITFLLGKCYYRYIAPFIKHKWNAPLIGIKMCFLKHELKLMETL